MVAVLSKVNNMCNTSESCVVIREASNDGRVRVRIIHGLTLVIKNSQTYCKNLQAIKTKHYVHAPRRIDW